MRRFHNGMKVYKKTACAGLAALMMLGALSGCGKGEPTTRDSIPSASTSGDAGETENEKFDEDSKEVKQKTKQIEGLIDKYFYFDEESDKREEGYYDGIMKGLDDPYSVYYTKEEYDRLKEDDSGSFEGIGATVTKDMDTGIISVVKPLEGSPAEAAGLEAGDVIIKVDDLELTNDMELDFVVGHIRGEKGTNVDIQVYREGEEDYLTFTITRDKIETKTVAYEMLEGDIGYIQVEQFIENTPELFKEAVDSLQKDGAKGIVIDLRDNPGGFVNSVIEMSDYLIDDNEVAEGGSTKGLLLQTKDKNDAVMDEYKCEDGHSVDIPMAVLVNGNSASASEIMAGCLKDYNKAELIGTTTYGKGIVQSVIPLSDGSAIKITIAQYFLPSGTAVHKVGVKPDKEVELDVEKYKKDPEDHKNDNQLMEAVKTLD